MEESLGAFCSFSPGTYLQEVVPMFTPEHGEQYSVEDLLRDVDTDGIQHAAHDIVGASTGGGTAMEIVRWEAGPLEVNGDLAHSGPHHVVVGDTSSLTATAPGEVKSLEPASAALTPPAPHAVRANSTTASDKDIVDHLRARLECKEPQQSPDPPELTADQARLDPWNLPVNQRFYRTTWTWGSDEKTDQGYWKPEGELEAIIGDTFVPFYCSQQYIGLKRTLEFYMHDGTKTSWRMTEYLPFYNSDGIVFVENLVFRRVFHHGAHGIFNNSPSMNINGDCCEDDLNRSDKSQRDCLNQHTLQDNQTPSAGKRARTNEPKISGSDVWQHYTRIYIKVPKEQAGSKKRKDSKKLMYAVCNYCHKVFHADSKQGTSHHKRHAEACLCKHSQPTSS